MVASPYSPPSVTKLKAPSQKLVASSDAAKADLSPFLPSGLVDREVTQQLIPAVAKDLKLIRLIEEAVRSIPTRHTLYRSDARFMPFLKPESVHLVVTSPPYWTSRNTKRWKASLGMWRITRPF